MIDIKKLADIQPSLTGNEFSVLFYITNSCSYAKSIGLDYYEASFKQIREHTNIKKNDTIITLLNHLVELGLITKQTEWSDEKNRKTKCKFTSSLVMSSGKNTLEVDSKSSGKNGLETGNKVATKEKSSPKNRLEIDSESSPKNGQINKLNNYKSKINGITSNISTLYGECEQTVNNEQLFCVDGESDIQRKCTNIKKDIDNGCFCSLEQLDFRIALDRIPATESRQIKQHYYQWCNS